MTDPRQTAVFTARTGPVPRVLLGKSGVLLMLLTMLSGCSLLDHAVDYFASMMERAIDYHSVSLRNASGDAVNIYSLFNGYPETVPVPVGEVGQIALYEVDPDRIFVFPKDLTHMEISNQHGEKLTLNYDQMYCMCVIYQDGRGCFIGLIPEMFNGPPPSTCESPPREQY